MHLHILGSGSKGNCSLVEGPEGLIMIDNGFPRREVLRRMEAIGINANEVRALIVTHEHSDHVKGLPVWCKHFTGPLFASAGTPEARTSLDKLSFHEFNPGDELSIAGISVQTFSTSHDVVNPIGLRFSCAGDAIGIMTDTGIVTDDAFDALADVRVLAIESNHDIPMLRTGPYPRYLQNRIASQLGHLSNEQAADAAGALVSDRTETLVAMHISQENNRPSLAVRALASALGAILDDELGSSATLERARTASLHIRTAGQNRPLTIW